MTSTILSNISLSNWLNLRVTQTPKQTHYNTTEALQSGQTKPSCKGIFQHLALSLGLYRPGPPAEFQDSAFDIPVLIKFQQMWGT